MLLADGDEDVRGAMRLLLTQELGMQVVGEAADPADLRALAQDTGPDLLLLDWALVGVEIDTVIAGLRIRFPHLHIVVLSAHPETRVQALTAGADAFVSKADAPAQLVTTLRALSTGDACESTGAAVVAADAPERGDS